MSRSDWRYLPHLSDRIVNSYEEDFSELEINDENSRSFGATFCDPFSSGLPVSPSFLRDQRNARSRRGRLRYLQNQSTESRHLILSSSGELRTSHHRRVPNLECIESDAEFGAVRHLGRRDIPTAMDRDAPRDFNHGIRAQLHDGRLISAELQRDRC